MPLLTDKEILNKSSKIQRAGSDEWCMEAWEVEDWIMEVRNLYEERIRELSGVDKTLRNQLHDLEMNYDKKLREKDEKIKELEELLEDAFEAGSDYKFDQLNQAVIKSPYFEEWKEQALKRLEK